MSNKQIDQTRAITINRDYSLVINFAVTLLLIIVAPLFQNQLVTGTIVNAILVSSVFLFGFNGAFLLVFIPSMISVFLGLLPVAMAPMIPFIFLGNFIFISTVSILKKKNILVAGSIAAALKALFLFISSYVLFNFFASGVSVKVVSSMMGYMQLLTALLGVVVAYGFLKIIKRV